MASFKSSRGVKNEINVTPLIDVVLVLLIIFMVVTPLLQRGKSVQLPASRKSDEPHESSSLVVSVLSDRSVWLENARVTTETLGVRLAQALAERPKQKILLKADRSLKVGPVREVLAIAKAGGIPDVSVAIDDKNPP